MTALVRLVEGERREQVAVAFGALFGLGVIGGLIAALWLAAGLSLVGLGIAAATRALRRRHKLGRLLDPSVEIERVEPVRWLGRPAMRVTFGKSYEVTLPTWNFDREQLLDLLRRRELPPARVVR